MYPVGESQRSRRDKAQTPAQDVCELCAEGVRCDECDDRMCSTFGPEPQPGGHRCEDCPSCDCTPCQDARADAAMEQAVQAEREAWAS